MKVELLRDIVENVQLNALGGVSDPGKLKESRRRGHRYPFSKGRVVEMSDASAQKYIDAKAARKTDAAVSPGIPIA